MIELVIPPTQLEAVRVSLLELYQVCVDALNHEASRHLRAGDSLPSIEARREELAAFDRMLARTGWPGEATSGEPLALSGPRSRLREILWVSVSRAATELDEACGGYWHGETPLEDLLAMSEGLRVRLQLLATIEAAD